MKTLEIGKCLQLRQNALVLNTSRRPLLKGQAPDTNPIFLPKFCWIFNLEGLSPRYWPHSCDTAFPYSALSVRVEGGGGETGEVRVSCTTFSCPPYFCAPLPPDFHPSLCWSRLQVNQEDQKPGLTFKKIAWKVNHSALSGALTEAAFLWNKFAPWGKIFSNLECAVVRSKLPRRSSMHGYFVSTLKNTKAD